MKIYKITWILFFIYRTMLCTSTLSALNTSLNKFLFRLLVFTLFAVKTLTFLTEGHGVWSIFHFHKCHLNKKLMHALELNLLLNP